MTGAQRFTLIGAGFNDFGQLDPEGSANADRFELMTFASLPGRLHISSTWDSTYVLAIEESGAVKRLARGRWASMISSVQQGLWTTGESVASIVEPRRGVMVILTTNGRVIAVEQLQAPASDGSCIPAVVSSETFDVVSLEALSSGGVYALSRDGTLRTCEVTREPFGLALGVQIPVRVPVLSVSCGADHTLLLVMTRQVMSFGVGTRGQLGHGDIINRKAPTTIEALDGVPMVAVTCGLWHSMALSECGDIYSWGWNEHAQVKPSSQTNPQPVIAIPTLVDPGAGEEEEFRSISCGARHSAAVTKGGRAYVWGWGYYGQLPVVPASYVCHSANCGHWNTLILVESRV